MTHRHMAVIAAVALVALILGACSAASGSAGAPGSDGPGGAPSGRISPPPSGDVVPGEVPDAVLASVIDAAAAETGVDPADVTVINAEAVTWSDGSLGCPEPGVLYTQALIDGYRVVVEAGGQALDYRIGNGEPRLCTGFQPGGSDG
jgi:hypothetical protein